MNFIQKIVQKIYCFVYELLNLFVRAYWFLWRKMIDSKFAFIGQNVVICKKSSFTYENIYIDNDCYIGEGALFLSTNAEIHVGKNVMFGPNVMLITGNHNIHSIGYYMSDVKVKNKTDDEDIVIEDDVWIGAGAIILKGVTIGTGSVIGAGAVVSRSVEPYQIYIGTHSSKVFDRFQSDELEMHLRELNRRYG